MLAFGAACFAGCTPGEPSQPGDGEAPSCVGIRATEAPIRLLTREQYNNTVRDLLGDTSRPADGFPRLCGPAGRVGSPHKGASREQRRR